METQLPILENNPESSNDSSSQGDPKYSFLNKKILDWYIAHTADKLVYEMQLFRKFESEIYTRNGIVYRPLDEAMFCNMVYQHALSEHIILKPMHCRQILESVLIRINESPCGPDCEDYTVFQNGLISNIDGTLSQTFPPDYFATIYVAANYLPDMQLCHPTADAFLATISGGDPELIARHWEFWGYVLSSDYHAKSIFSLYGESGNNGKSTELSFLRTFLPGAVDSMSIKTMTSQFGRHRIRHCRLEYSADEGAVNLNSERIGFLKSASGFDDMTADRKNREMVHFTCKCKIAIASNYNIGMAYSAVDMAFARRIVNIPYPYSIPKEQQDPLILQKLLAEKDAIATEAFRAYLRLKANNYKFTGYDRFDQIQTIFTSPVNAEYNSIREFSQNYCDFSDPNAFTNTQELYAAFASHYRTNIHDTTGFSQAFRLVNQDMIQSKRLHISGSNLRGFTGVKLLPT